MVRKPFPEAHKAPIAVIDVRVKEELSYKSEKMPSRSGESLAGITPLIILKRLFCVIGRNLTRLIKTKRQGTKLNNI